MPSTATTCKFSSWIGAATIIVGTPVSAIPSLFISVSLSAHSKNQDEVDAARDLAQRFAQHTGWQPSRMEVDKVAGLALPNGVTAEEPPEVVSSSSPARGNR